MTFEATIDARGRRACYVDGLRVPEDVYDTLHPSKLFPRETGWTVEEALAVVEGLRASVPKRVHKGPYFALAINDAHPLKSEALACHPKQIAAIRARNRKHGLDIPYDRHGRPVFTDAGQRRKLMKIESEAMGTRIVQQNSYTGY